MTDFIITFLVFFLTAHLTMAFQRFLHRYQIVSSYFKGGRGLYLIVTPVFVALSFAGLSIFPHLLGTFNGAGHTTKITHVDQQQAISLWLLGLLFFIGLRFCFHILAEISIGLHLRKSSVSAESELLEKISEALKPMDEACEPRVFFHKSERYYEPFIRGFLRPAIYLHVDLVKTLSTSHLGAALFHEIGHQKRGDHLIMGLYSLILSPLGVTQVVRQGFDSWAESSERNCDVIAAQYSGSGRTVAEALVAVLKFSNENRAPSNCLALCGHRAIKDRVAKLISPNVASDLDSIESKHVFRGGMALISACLFLSCTAPNYGLELYCFFEQLVGTYCVG